VVIDLSKTHAPSSSSNSAITRHIKCFQCHLPFLRAEPVDFLKVLERYAPVLRGQMGRQGDANL
jgi:hypothetical protein